MIPNVDKLALNNRKVGYIGSIVRQSGVGMPVEIAPKPKKDITFGLPNKPSTPITGIISNTYANLAEEDLEQEYARISRVNDLKKKKKLLAMPTKASDLLR